MIGKNDPCWCGSGKKWKKCHFPELSGKTKKIEELKIEQSKSEKPKSDLKQRYLKSYGIILKTPQEIEGIRASCRLASKILDATCAQAKEGVTTAFLNAFANQMHQEHGAIPAPLGYGEPPFPKSICTSLNEVICHGIPDQTILKKGDILNIDVTCILDGYYGDCSRMVIVGGETTADKERVVKTSYECLMRAINAVKPGEPLSIIGEAIQIEADKNGCSVVHQFVAHGVGVHFHEAPQIPHYRNRIQTLMVPGMTFTIEPMINLGKSGAIIDRNDQWTARTVDGLSSAQWEHTILVTEDGHEILTCWKPPE